jgi:hypothetical protein
MKHVKVLSKPASAEQTSWLEVKNVVSLIGLPIPLSARQANWLATQWDDLLQK